MIASVCPATNRLGLQTLRTNSVKPARPGRVQQVLVCLTVFLMFLMATGSALALGVGQRVQANGTVNVRNAPAGAILGTQSTGRQGTIIGGPQTVSLSGTSYTWWSINWDSSVDGWVASGGLTGLAPAAPTLNAPGDSSGPGSTTASLTPVLSWNAVNGATNYGVYVWDMTSGGLVYNRDYVGNVTSTTLPALSAGHHYRWNVRASNDAGFSGYSGLLYFQTKSSAKVLNDVMVNCPAMVTEKATAACSAVARFNDGSTSTVTTSASWTDNSPFATINNSGVLSAGAVGADQAVTVTAGYTYAGVTKSGTAVLTIKDVPPAKTLTGVTVACPATVNENTTGSCAATARFSDNSTLPVTTLASWTDNSAYATINSAGVLSAAAVTSDQAVTVTASYAFGGVTKVGTFALTIKNVALAKTLSRVDVTCPPTINENSSGTCAATAVFSDNSALTVTNLASWTENSTYATITGPGVLSAAEVPSDQPVTVSASYTSAGVTKFGTAALTIKNVTAAKTLSSVQVACPTSVNENTTGNCTATARFSDTSSLSVTTKVNWTESSPYATINDSGVLSAGAVPTDQPVTVSASYTNAGVTKSGNFALTIKNASTSAGSLSALIAGEALAQVLSPVHASPRSLANISTLFAEMDAAGTDQVLRKQVKSWWSDLEDGTAGIQDGTRMRNAIRRYSVWKASPPASRETFAIVRDKMQTDVAANYDVARQELLAARIVAVWDTKELHFNQRVPGATAPTVPASDQETIDFIGVRAMCFEWVATVGLRAGAESVFYSSPAVPLASSHRPGMAMFWYTPGGTGAHAAIITSIEFDLHGNPAYYTVAESNFARGWQNPGGAIPWLREITSRRVRASVNPSSKPTEMSISGRVVSFGAR